MEFKLTTKCQFNKRCKDNKSRSYIIYFLNGIQILKQKIPFDETYSFGYGHTTGIQNIYLRDGKLWQTRTRNGEIRNVYFPISKKLLKDVPRDLKIELFKD